VNSLVELLKASEGKLLVDEDGNHEHLRLLPPLSSAELQALANRIPCPVPQEVQELFSFSRGFKGGALAMVDFSGVGEGWQMEEILPHALPLAGDGFGNYWVVDLTSNSTTWGPIFYASHDAPVIVFQADNLQHFVSEVLKFSSEPRKSEIDDVHERLSRRIWSQNPGVLSRADSSARCDPELRQFAATLDDTWEFIDLRNAKLGDGFSWGLYGPRTANRRFGEKRIFARQKKSLGRRFIDAVR
jgi:SMI1 / KNR4 family (SUKH-1)